MEWVAILGALVSLGVATAGLVQASRTESKRAKTARDLAELESNFRRTERLESKHDDLQAKLDAQREPLIEAVVDLQSRLRNIRHQRFLGVYVEHHNARRSELAVLSTMFRLGKYFAAVETVRHGADTWTLEHDPATKGVAHAVEEVSATLATDRFDELMIWREEQRAIGELMLASESHTPIGFAEFAARYDADFRPWLTELREGLREPGVAASPRLERLEDKLEALRVVLVAGRRPESPG